MTCPLLPGHPRGTERGAALRFSAGCHHGLASAALGINTAHWSRERQSSRRSSGSSAEELEHGVLRTARVFTSAKMVLSAGYVISCEDLVFCSFFYNRVSFTIVSYCSRRLLVSFAMTSRQQLTLIGRTCGLLRPRVPRHVAGYGSGGSRYRPPPQA